MRPVLLLWTVTPQQCYSRWHCTINLFHITKGQNLIVERRQERFFLKAVRTVSETSDFSCKSEPKWVSNEGENVNLHARERADAHLARRPCTGPRCCCSCSCTLPSWQNVSFQNQKLDWQLASQRCHEYSCFLFGHFFLIKISSDPTCEFHTDQGYSSGTIQSQPRAYFNVWGFVFWQLYISDMERHFEQTIYPGIDQNICSSIKCMLLFMLTIPGNYWILHSS